MLIIKLVLIALAPCQVFRAFPSDEARTFEDVDKLRAATTLATVHPDLARCKLSTVQGHVVMFPLRFLEQEALKPGLGTKEALLPAETWT